MTERRKSPARTGVPLVTSWMVSLRAACAGVPNNQADIILTVPDSLGHLDLTGVDFA